MAKSMVNCASSIAANSCRQTGRRQVASGRPCWFCVKRTLYVNASGKSLLAQLPELAARSGAAQVENGATEQSERAKDCAAAQLNGPTRVPGSSAPPASASQTSSEIVIIEPRETTARCWEPSADC